MSNKQNTLTVPLFFRRWTREKKRRKNCIIWTRMWRKRKGSQRKKYSKNRKKSR